jgi:3-hydroxyacyl-[acyl-carrier-protein] dehydratase
MSQVETKSSSGFGYDEITRLLPHRSPLLLVDRVTELEVGREIRAIKAISSLDPVFAGHFPGQPIFPGVYMIEGLAQTSALLTFKTYEARGVRFRNETLLTGVESVRFRRIVVPGDVLTYHVRLKRERGAFAWFEGEALVDGDMACEAAFSARVSVM